MENDWRNGTCSGICGAENAVSCLGSWFCAPCLFGRASDRLNLFPEMDRERYNMTNENCLIMCGAACFGVSWLPLLLKRGEVRNRFGIPGEPINDCLLSFFCGPCTLAQMETELKDRATIAQQSAPQGYEAKQQTMVYETQK